MRNSIALSTETEAKTEAARQAWGVLRKTFEQWTVIGAAIVALRGRANELGGRKTFHRLLEQQGLGALAKAKAITSRLEKIMTNLPEVVDWHSRLEPKKQVEWSSPTSVCRNCPALWSTKAPRPQPTIAKPENLAKVMERQDARIEELQQEIESLNEKLEDDRSFWEDKADRRLDLTDPNADVLAATIIEQAGDLMAEKIARELLEQLGLATPARKKSKTKAAATESP
jgi:hypothetical protein